MLTFFEIQKKCSSGDVLGGDEIQPVVHNQ
jgi:hypothetical protein